MKKIIRYFKRRRAKKELIESFQLCCRFLDYCKTKQGLKATRAAFRELYNEYLKEYGPDDDTAFCMSHIDHKYLKRIVSLTHKNEEK